MHLSKFCDYALRSLMYLGARPGTVTAAEDIARAFGISGHHVVKSLQALCRANLVRSVPGRGGGYVFEGVPQRIKLGDAVQTLEPNFHMAECFAPEKNTCPLPPGCGLQGALSNATGAFLDNLNRYTLKDLIETQTERLLSLED